MSYTTKTRSNKSLHRSNVPDIKDRPAVLMVDDQPARLLTYDVILQNLPVERVHARSAREALTHLLHREFAVILLDVHMPEMDGFELAREIRGHPRMEHMPIIFVTGMHMNEMDQLKGYEVGAVDYLSVPVVPEILRSKVAVLIELYQRRSELLALNQALTDARNLLEAERAQVLSEKENYRRAVVDHPHDSVFVLQAERDPTGNIVDWVYRNANHNALKSVDMTLESLTGKRLSELFPNDAQRVDALCTQVVTTGESVQCHLRYGEADFQVAFFSIGNDLVVSSGIDITESKRNEAKTYQDVEHFQSIAETLPQIVWSARGDGFSDYYNQQFLTYLGCTREAMQGDAWVNTLHPDDMASAVKAWTHAVETGNDFAIEFRIRRASDGEYRWHDARAAALRDAHGKIVRWFGTCIDIHDHRIVTDALATNERRHRALLEKAPVGVAHNTLDGRFVYANDAFCKLVGYTAEELQAKTWQEITHPEDVIDDMSLAQHVLAGKLTHYNIDKRYIRKDKSQVWVSLFGNFIFDEQGNPTLGVAIAVDNTERKIAEDALRDSEQRFRELANNIDQLVWTCDELGQATWYNDRWYQYTGTNFDQMRGDGWKAVHDPEHVDRVIAGLKSSIASGQPWEDTFPLRGKDGAYRWFLSRAVPIYNDQGVVIRWMGTNTDVTEQRHLQDKLRESSRRKDEFLAMLAHELRNPMAPIRSAVDLLSRMMPEHTQQRGLVNIIQRQTDQLTVLLDNLLDSARVTQGRVELRRELLSVQSCIDLAIEATQPLIREQRHRLTLEPLLTPVFVDADKIRLIQCLTNLLTNAAKFTNTGGEIRISLKVVDNEVAIGVKDTGMGIDPVLLPDIFDMFVQGERGLDRSQGGLGIGLTVCKRLIELHGGTLTASSDGLGKGALFEVRLPLAEKPEVMAAPVSNKARSSQRILVVDDNEDAADTLSMLLQLSGHQTRTVYSARQALDAVTDFAPHIVFLDIGLPEIDGYEVARRIKSAHNAPRIIALSGYGQAEDKQRSKAAGFEEHLIKPVDATTLDEILFR